MGGLSAEFVGSCVSARARGFTQRSPGLISNQFFWARAGVPCKCRAFVRPIYIFGKLACGGICSCVAGVFRANTFAGNLLITSGNAICIGYAMRSSRLSWPCLRACGRAWLPAAAAACREFNAHSHAFVMELGVAFAQLVRGDARLRASFGCGRMRNKSRSYVTADNQSEVSLTATQPTQDTDARRVFFPDAKQPHTGCRNICGPQCVWSCSAACR